jgi:hypothetical protein
MPIGRPRTKRGSPRSPRDGEPYDTSWLAYTVYADPSRVVV